MTYNINEKPMQNKRETVEEVKTYPIRAIPERGLTKETCEHFGFRVALNEQNGKDIEAIYSPIYKKGELVGYQKKDLTVPKDHKYHFTHIGSVTKDCDLFGMNVAPTGGKKSFTTEGYLDTAAAWQTLKERYPSGNPAVVGVASTSWAKVQVGHNLDFYSKFSENIFAFDQDEATPEEKKKGVKKGKEALQDVALLIPDIKVAKFSENDPNKMLLDGKKDELYWALVSKAEKYKPEEIKFGGDISLEDIMTPLEEGLYIEALPLLMKKLHGLRKPELTILLAPTKSGKSTICREIGYGILKKGAFLGNLFLEEDMKKTTQAYLCLDNNTLLPAFREDPSIIPKGDLQKSYDEILNNGKAMFLEASKLDPETVLTNMRFMAAMGAEYIILDHLSYVFSGSKTDNERKDIDLLLHELAAFKKEANVHVIVVAHIKRKDFQPKKTKEGDIIYPYWIPVNKEDGRGSGAFEQLCDNLITIEPEVVAEGKRGRIRLKVEAAREWDDTGIADVLIMDRNTGRMVNAENTLSF